MKIPAKSVLVVHIDGGKMKNKRSIREIKPLLKDIKEALNKIYGDRLLEMILYGSFARDDATDDSDIDIAVLLKGDVDKFREIERMSTVIYQIVLEYGELVAFYPLQKMNFLITSGLSIIIFKWKG